MDTGVKIHVYGRPLCSACQRATAWLRARKHPFEYTEFNMDDLAKDNREDVMAMAMYHYQEETLPVFVVDGEGLTFSEVKEKTSASAS